MGERLRENAVATELSSAAGGFGDEYAFGPLMNASVAGIASTLLSTASAGEIDRSRREGR